MTDEQYIEKQKNLADAYAEGKMSDDAYIKAQSNLSHRHIEGKDADTSKEE